MRTKSILTGVVVVTAVAGLLLFATDFAAPVAQSTGDMAASARGNLVAAPGWVEPASEERELSAELRGRLVRIHVEEGDKVHEGQVLAKIYDADYVARVRQAKALVNQRAAELQKLIKGARDEERRQARAELREAQAELENARKDLARRQPLAKRGHTSKEALNDSEAEVRAAQARVDARAERVALIEPRAEDVEIARALLENARAQLAEAEAWLGRTRIKSPVDGTVLHRARDEGEAVTDEPPTLVFRVGDLSRLRVRADVDETDVARISVGMPAYVTADAFPGARFAGTVIRVGSRMGRKTLRTDEPTERLDTKMLETLIELNAEAALPVGLRVDTFIQLEPQPAG